MSGIAISGTTPLVRPRIGSIDLLRGTIMIIMALDHVRDYFHGAAYVYDPLDLQQTSPAIFFTRWITHFCAPIFMLLAGISACMYGMKHDQKKLAFFLLSRGVWLILVEGFIVTLEWTFNPHYPVLILQVLWAFGCSMIVLSLLIWLPRRLLLLIGVLLVAGHNLLDGLHVAGDGASAFFWAVLHEQKFYFAFGPPMPVVGYPILPWIGIMVTGYCLGDLYRAERAPASRKRILLSLGLGAIVLFILLRAVNVYGDHNRWSVQKNALFTIMSFLNTSKYPPSLLYSLMTLGPALVFLALSERAPTGFGARLTVFGRVPMFYYLIHIPLIHLLAMIASGLTGHGAANMVNLSNWVTANPQLKGYGFSLPVVYAVWIVVILLLYPLCKWFDDYKRAHQREKAWLSYL